MALVATRVLIVNRQLNFAVSIKQALERVGGFEVVPFTSADTALEYLRLHPQDVALVDLTLPEMPGIDVVLRMRSIQPDLAIIATPKRPDVASIVHDLDLQGVVDVPVSTRDLVPLIHDAVTQMRDTLPDTAQAPAVNESETLNIAPPEAPSPEDVDATPPPAPPQIPEVADSESVLAKLGGLESEAQPETPSEELEDTPLEVPPVESPAVEHPPQPVEFVLPDTLPPESPPQPAPSSEDLFRKLAAEEPPMPPLEESGTVRDLMDSVDNADLGKVMALLQSGETPAPAPPKEDALEKSDEDRRPPPALVILETALDETTPLEAFSLNDLLSNIEQQSPEHQRPVRPLPSWFYDSEKFVREPDFLPEELPAQEQTEEYIGQTTQPSAREQQLIAARPEELETERLEQTRRSKPIAVEPAAMPESPPEAAAEALAPLEDTDALHGAGEKVSEEADTARGAAALAEPEAPPAEAEPVEAAALIEDETAYRAGFERLAESQTAPAAPEVLPELPPQEALREIAPTPLTAEERIPQLALILTQLALETTADATLLAREGEIVAYAGTLPRADVEDIRDAVANDWEASPNQARIRFVTLPSSGKNYMLYSRHTEEGFTLTMIFAGNMPLRVIRRQSDRLMEALIAVPEKAAETAPITLPEQTAEAQLPEAQAVQIAIAPPPPEVVGPLSAYSYVWLLRDPDDRLSDAAMSAIRDQLRAQLVGLGWQVATLEVHEDYVYLLADVPAEPPPNEIIQDLKRRSAQIAAQTAPRAAGSLDPETLWADSYMVLTPGRELKIEEIQRFINFAR